jgi:hypothetical protein
MASRILARSLFLLFSLLIVVSSTVGLAQTASTVLGNEGGNCSVATIGCVNLSITSGGYRGSLLSFGAVQGATGFANGFVTILSPKGVLLVQGTNLTGSWDLVNTTLDTTTKYQGTFQGHFSYIASDGSSRSGNIIEDVAVFYDNQYKVWRTSVLRGTVTLN